MKDKSYRCGCSNAKAYCSMHSKIKMKVMPKRYNRINNMTFYSFLKENKKSNKEIVTRMLKRLEYNFTGLYNCIIFYDNTTNQEIFRYKP
jgi:hypothetical protein